MGEYHSSITQGWLIQWWFMVDITLFIFNYALLFDFTCPLDIFCFCIGSLYQQFLDGLLTELPSYRCKFIFANTVLDSRLTNKRKRNKIP